MKKKNGVFRSFRQINAPFDDREGSTRILKGRALLCNMVRPNMTAFVYRQLLSTGGAVNTFLALSRVNNHLSTEKKYGPVGPFGALLMRATTGR